jgi:hypothetical protein
MHRNKTTTLDRDAWIQVLQVYGMYMEEANLRT